MKERDFINLEFASSVIFGLIKVLYDWIGIGMKNMTNHVGIDFITSRLTYEENTRQEIFDQIARLLVDEYKVCESVHINLDEEESTITIKAKNCLLLSLEKNLKEKLRMDKFIICPFVNIAIEAMNRTGTEAEKRTFNIVGEECHHVIGLIPELEMETELKKE